MTKRSAETATQIMVVFLAAFCAVIFAPAGVQSAQAPIAPPVENPTGDLPVMLSRNRIRVLVSYNRTNFFIVGGELRGLEYEMFQQYGKFLNKRLRRRRNKLRIAYVPVPFDQLIPALLEGRGDIAAAGLTITPQRKAKVAFTDPYVSHVDEIVVASKAVTGLRTLDDLSGRKVYVLRGSSYAEHLRKINQRLRAKGRAPVDIVEAPQNLATEDILELVNASIVELMVADRHIAEVWSKVLTDLVLRKDLKVHTGGKIAWAVRKENPQLHKSLNEFIHRHKKGTLIGNVLFERYYENTQWIKNPLARSERRKLEKYILWFQKYGKRYGIDWLTLAAQAYQESGLDHNRKSPRGAVGVMQMLPSTAASPNVNIPDIHRPEKNIHAGVKYLAFIRKRYFNDPAISSAARLDFALAAYNAGPSKVQQLRRKTKTMGLDPNTWFFNVERAALRSLGQETVRYVANIHKYYIAYKLSKETLDKKAEELKALGAGHGAGKQRDLP